MPSRLKPPHPSPLPEGEGIRESPRRRCWPRRARCCRWRGKVDVDYAGEISEASPQKHLILQHLLDIRLDHSFKSRTLVHGDCHGSVEVDHLVVHENSENV